MRLWGFRNIVSKVFGNKDSAYKGEKKTDHDICEDPANKAEYENSYKQVYPLGTGICGCHYPPDAVFHEELKGPYYQRVGQGSKTGGVDIGSAACLNVQNKQGKNSTTAGACQTVNRNATRISYGNGQGQSPMCPVGGGCFTDVAGKSVGYNNESRTEASSKNIGIFTPGNMTMNAEKGVGIGVNKGSNQNVWTRWEPDGTFHLQVKPSGGSGGNAFVRIDPNGDIFIESKQSCNITAKHINIKSKSMTVDVNNTQWNGKINQDGIHKDSRGHHCPKC